MFEPVSPEWENTVSVISSDGSHDAVDQCIIVELPKHAEIKNSQTLIDELLAEQRTLTAVERFSRAHELHEIPAGEKQYRRLLPASAPKAGEQYAFEVELDKCSGCKACVTACHSLNGLDENETWRGVGLLISPPSTLHSQPFQQHITTACHHCLDPGCLNGCPVLAYDKDPRTGIVRHLDDQCIGCQYCVMKCPYEVPKYSARLGIVRKCDMCANRLAVGEAPACAQACPSEAIKIALVETLSATRRPLVIPFLPDSPNPKITLPTTRYLSKRALPQNLFAADHDKPRLDHSHWPLVIMLVLTQAAAGLFVANVFAREIWLSMVGFLLLVIGMVAAVFHLGQPMKAWRAFLGWRKSWLSRELIALNFFVGIAALAIAFSVFAPESESEGWSELKRIALVCAAAAGLLSVFASAMVYVDTQRPFWHARFSFGNFFGTTLQLGVTFAAAIFGWAGKSNQSQSFALMALFFLVAMFTWRSAELGAARKNSESPIHFNARIICELLPPTTSVLTQLFAAGVVLSLLAASNLAHAGRLWASALALAVFSSEIIARWIFFTAGASKRMPGGVAA